MSRYADVAFTEAVRAAQAEHGSGRAMAARLGVATSPDPLSDMEIAFVRSRDSFFVASVSETGWPYVQHRGGPPGFVHVLDEHTLAWIEVRGNRQYITKGNVRGDDRVALFFLDQAGGARLKMFGHATVHRLDDDPGLVARLAEPRTDGIAEGLTVVSVEGISWNCHKHITPRFTEAEISAGLEPVRQRLRELEQENAELRQRLRALGHEA